MVVSAVDFGLLFAVMAFGWGLSLAVYRYLADELGWPMGAVQRQHPDLARILGQVCVGVAVLFCLWRGYAGYPLSALMILVFGLAWSAFWTGFLRTGAQSALILAPAATVCLTLRWLFW
ncbi:MAG: hypothetical protein NW223_19320 [Hyphomicrobiaceae bacterium]|nr:hypothetical protein [Hyphomicrobiaceae bacterium]